VVAYLLGALVVMLVLAFVVLPLVRRPAEPTTIVRGPSPAEERAGIYRALVELELDQRVGKITEADFQETQQALLGRAAALIAEEDASAAAIGERVEREIAAMRESLRAAPEAHASETHP